MTVSSPGSDLIGPYIFIVYPKGSGKALKVFKRVGGKRRVWMGEILCPLWLCVENRLGGEGS